MGCAREPWLLRKLHMHELNTSRLTTEMEQAFADTIVCSSVCLGGGQKKGLIKCTCNFLTVRVLCAKNSGFSWYWILHFQSFYFSLSQDDPDTVLKCLTVASEMLQGVTTSGLNPTLMTLVQTLVSISELQETLCNSPFEQTLPSLWLLRNCLSFSKFCWNVYKFKSLPAIFQEGRGRLYTE